MHLTLFLLIFLKVLFLGLLICIYKCAQAAELLDCKPLREECLNIYVDYIQSHTSAQIREHFGLPDDLTEEEKEEQRKKNAWCYDPLEQGDASNPVQSTSAWKNGIS